MGLVELGMRVLGFGGLILSIHVTQRRRVGPVHEPSSSYSLLKAILSSVDSIYEN